MNNRITQQELESYLWGAAVLLRGLIDAGDYKQFIFPLLFFKRVSDVWEEEYQAALADSDGDLSYAEFAEWVIRMIEGGIGNLAAPSARLAAKRSGRK